nr:MAG TPA: hypothetical protein [Caudoviricetes sp.]DAW85762.1 MAG TPA: hypothetical protein [Bacteriophage sp.]
MAVNILAGYFRHHLAYAIRCEKLSFPVIS